MPYFPRPRSVVATGETRVRNAVDGHYDAIWRFLRRLGVTERDAEDAAQRVFLVFAQKLGGIEPHAERAFLFASALRVAADARKRRARSREDVTPDGAPVDARDDAASPEEQVDDRRRRVWLDRVLDMLPDEHRAVFVLCDIEEQTMAEASVVLAIPPGTVASRLRRARELFESEAAGLKTLLDSRGIQ